MRPNAVQGYARNLASMVSSGRLIADFEMLADLPDGQIEIDLRNGLALHSKVGPIQMMTASAVSSWFMERMSLERLDQKDMEDARVTLTIDTRDPPTNRASYVSFHIHCAVLLKVKGRLFTEERREHHWHNRPSTR